MNFSRSSSCHWTASGAGATISTRSARPRTMSSSNNDPSLNGLSKTDLVADEITVAVGIQDLVGSLNLIRFDLDTIVRQREEAVVSIGKIKTSRTLSEIVVERIVNLLGCEPVNDGVDPFDMGQATREFSELSLCGIDMEELTSSRAILDFRDLALFTGELDVVANYVISRQRLRTRRSRSPRQ